MYKYGAWTPWADVVCYNCSDNDIEELEEGRAVTFCDRCGAKIQVNEGVAYEHNLVAYLKSLGFCAHMEQTGGMCSACCVERGSAGENGFFYICYNLNGDNEYLLEAYDYDEEWIEDDCWRNLIFETKEELVDFIRLFCDVKSC